VTVRGARPARATLVDVALAAQVSRQTVSNVLNNPGKVAPETMARVRSEIERLSFRPNLTARALRKRKANALGIEMTATGQRRLGSILDSFLVELTISAREQDAHVITFAAADYLNPIAEYERLLSTQMVGGFVLTNTRREDPRPGWLHGQGIPFVSFGRVWDDPGNTSWADVDGKAGTASAVRHLVQRGYAPIGFLGWPHGSPVGDDRRAGWVTATQQLGIFHEGLQAVSAQDMADAAEPAGSLIERVGTGGAIICASDTLALAAYQMIQNRGLRPGADMGLIGFDDSDLAQVFGLTSLRQPLAEIAKTLLTRLNEAESGAVAPSHGVLFDPLVIPRDSTDRSGSAHEFAIFTNAGNRTDDGDS
jgi:DNA-binding LacI/PurR family transcriptional regulator